jgi:hypothetical protein
MRCRIASSFGSAIGELPIPYFSIKHPNILDPAKSKLRASRREETAPAGENLRRLWPPLCLAEEMGARLGASSLL